MMIILGIQSFTIVIINGVNFAARSFYLRGLSKWMLNQSRILIVDEWLRRVKCLGIVDEALVERGRSIQLRVLSHSEIIDDVGNVRWLVRWVLMLEAILYLLRRHVVGRRIFVSGVETTFTCNLLVLMGFLIDRPTILKRRI